MKVFRVEGTFRMGRFIQPFRKEIAAADDAIAREIVYGDLGSKHGTVRREIVIVSVVELPEDQVTDPVARAKAGIAG